MKSSDSKIAWVVPSRYGVFNESPMSPRGVTIRRFSDTGGRQM